MAKASFCLLGLKFDCGIKIKNALLMSAFFVSILATGSTAFGMQSVE
jgi:hypothetical protein